MKRIRSIFKKSSMILTLTLLLGAVLVPTSQVKAAANWWWITHNLSQSAPGAYVCKVGATSNGVPIKAALKGVSTSTRLWVYSYGAYWVTSPSYSQTGTLEVWSESGYYINQY